MKLTATTPIRHDGKTVGEGEHFEATADEAKSLIDGGLATAGAKRDAEIADEGEAEQPAAPPGHTQRRKG